MIGEGSRLGVGSLIRFQAPTAPIAVSWVPRFFIFGIAYRDLKRRFNIDTESLPIGRDAKKRDK